jgi:hypothetical protein
MHHRSDNEREFKSPDHRVGARREHMSKIRLTWTVYKHVVNVVTDISSCRLIRSVSVCGIHNGEAYIYIVLRPIIFNHWQYMNSLIETAIVGDKSWSKCLQFPDYIEDKSNVSTQRLQKLRFQTVVMPFRINQCRKGSSSNHALYGRRLTHSSFMLLILVMFSILNNDNNKH